MLSLLVLGGRLAAHGPVYKPPPTPPYDKVAMEWVRNILPPPITPQTPGPAAPTTSTGAHLPMGTGTGGRSRGRGGMTKKSRGITATGATWEYWWARNRFRYLSYPGIAESAARAFPSTYDGKGGDGEARGLALLRTRLLEEVRPLLGHKEARLRRAALFALGFLDDGDSLEAVKGRLRDPNQTVSDAAVLAMGMLRSPGALHGLMHIARGSEEGCRLLGQSAVPEYSRGFAAASLALHGGPGVEAVLRSLLVDRSGSSELRAMAASGLGILGTEACAAQLMRFVQAGEAPPRVKAAALAALGAGGAPIARAFLRRSLRADAVAVRQSAALGIGETFSGDHETVLRELWLTYNNSRDAALQGFALLAMGRLGGARAQALLCRVLDRERGDKAAWAALALGFALRAGPLDTGAAQRLVKLLSGHGNASLRGAAAVALGLAAPAGAREALLKALGRESVPEVRGYCATALGMLSDPSVAKALRTCLEEDPLPQVKTRAAAALAMLRDREAVPLLLDLLFHSPSDAVKTFAALGLGFMGDVHIVEAVLQHLAAGERDSLTRSRAVRLAARLLSGRTAPYLEPLARGSNFASEFPLQAYLLDFGL